MSPEEHLKKFESDHPWPSSAGINSLFRFSSFNREKIHFLEHLLVDGKLYHATPSQFNDPFECKPYFSWPPKARNISEIRKYLRNLLKSEGIKHKKAGQKVSKLMRDSNLIRSYIHHSAQHAFSKIRICSFTTTNRNLLFWSHYASSHKGFCIEYDATVFPISYAFKVRYVDKYPEVQYPAPADKTGLKPALLKSKDWEYENEFRTIFVPSDVNVGQPDNDGSSLILKGNEIKNIYFGVKMDEEDKHILIRLVNKGPFNPGLWDSELSQTNFGLKFKPHRKV